MNLYDISRRHRFKKSLVKSRAKLRSSKRRQLLFEALEERRLLAGFTWEMTPRVVADADGRIAVPNNSVYADPDAFEVVFDGSSTSPSASTYTWSITTTANSQNYGGTASQPRFSTRVPEGTYDVTLTVNGSPNPVETIFVNDILVVTMGDSMSAGEGNPETTLDDTNPVEWMQVGDTTLYPPAPDSGTTHNSPVSISNTADVEEEQARYHTISSRSSYAAGAQMALQLENADPHSSVTFVFVAASGSSIGSVPKDPNDASKRTVGGGALLPYVGQDVAAGFDSDDLMPSQIDQVKDIINGRGVEVLTFSFGINDVAFTRIAKALLLLREGNFESDIETKLDNALNTGSHQAWTALRQEVNFDTDSAIENQPVGGGIDGLPSGYAQLEAQLNTLSGTASAGPDKVYILEYMDLFSEFTNTTVTTCDKIMEDLLPLGAKLDATEIAWAKSRIFDTTDPARTTLNEAVANGAAANGWTLIDDIATSFDGHGYCASDDDRWVRRAEEAAQLQGPNQAMTTGTLHPNRRGQAKIGELLTQQVLTDLFPTVVANNPGAVLQDLITSSNNYFQEIIDSPLEGSSGKHTLQDVLKDGLSGLFDLPLIRESVDFVDLDGLFNTILSDLGAPLEVQSNSAPLLTIPSGPSGNGDASFMVTLDNLGPINVRISPQSFNTAPDMATEFNAQLTDAGFGDRLEAEIVLGTGNLRLKTASGEALSVTTLQLRADASAPANGRLDGPSVATQLTVDYQTGTGNSTYQTSQTLVSFTIDSNGVTYTDGSFTKTIPTAANVDASDLVDAINQMLKEKGLYDVVAIVDRGANGMLDKNPQGLLLTDSNYPIAAANRDRLVFAATTKSVTGISISNAQLGFNSSTTATQPLDQTSTNNNQNPAWTHLKFRGQSDVPGAYPIGSPPELIPESLTQFIDVYIDTPIPSADMKSELLSQLGSRLTASLNKLSLAATTDPFWPPGLTTTPANFMVVPSFTAGSGDRELTYQVQVDHLFQKPFEWDLSNDGIKVGSLGTIEVGGTIDSTLIAPTHLDLKLGMYLGDLVSSPLNAFNPGVNYVGVPFDQNTPLRFLNAGKGVPLLVGITAPNPAPATGTLAGDAAFYLTISKNTSILPSIHYFNLKQFSTGNTTDPISSDNATPQNLADDLNMLFRRQGVHDLVRAAVLVEQGGTGLTERLYIHGIDSSVIGLTIAGSGGENLGFATLQNSGLNISGMSNWADLEVKVGSTSYFVDLDHARTLQDVKFAIQIQTLGAVMVLIDNPNQRLKVSSTNNSDNVYVSGGQGIVGVSDRFATASALGILHEDVPNSPALQAIFGHPLHGLGFDDRSYVDTTYTNEDISLGVGFVVDNTDVSAALGPISFDLVGNNTSAADASLSVFGTLNIKDVKDSNDHRLYLTEEFNSAKEILSLNVFTGGLPCGITGQAEFEIGFSLVGDLTDSFLHSTISVSDTVPIELDFSQTTDCGIHFKPKNPSSPSVLQSILAQAKNLDLADLLEALKGIGNYFKSNPPEAFDLNIPLINKTVGDVVNFADALINAADDFISSIDVDAVKQAVDAVGTAISNLNVPQALHESRLRMLAAVDAIQRVLANAADVDLDGNLRLEGRLIATVRQLYRTVLKETRDSSGVLLPTLNLQLIDTLNAALRTLIDQIPSFDTAKSQLEKAVSKSIADTFGVPVTTVTFTFDYIKDYDTSTSNTDPDQPAIAFGLTYDEANLVAVSGGDNWPLTVGGKQVQVTLGGATADLEFRAGLKVDIGAGITLQPPRKLFLIANSTNPDLTNTKIVVDAGLNAQVTGSLGYKSFDLVEATVTAAFRAPTIDTWLATSTVPLPLGTPLPLTGIPEGGLDPRLIIVTSFSSPGHVLKSSGATPAYTLTESPQGTFNLTILAWPPDQVVTWPLGQTGPSRVTAEYLTAATINFADPADRANRASLALTLDRPLNQIDPAGCITPSFSNTIGAIGFDDIPCSIAFAANGLLTADVDATVLNSSVDNMITVAISAQHPLQPQFDFDETLIDDLFQGIDFNLCLIVPSIEKFLLKLEDDVADGALAKLPIAGKNIAQQTKVIKTIREEFAGPFLNYLCHDPSASGALDAAAVAIQGWLNENLRTALGLPSNSTDVSVVVTITEDTFEIYLNVDKTETFTADFDSGLDGLPIKASGQGGVDVSLGFEIHVGFGLSKADGFYIKPNPTLPELMIAASAKLQVGDAATANPIPTSLTVDLFGLDLSATDILTTSSSGLAETGTFIIGDISFNIDSNSGVASDGKLTISELTSTPFLSLIDPATPLVELDAQVHLALEAGLTSTLPSVQANLMLDWRFKLTVENGEIVAVNEGFEFGFEDIGINLGDFLTKHIRPVLDQINKYIEPLQPIIDFLKTEIPGVTELSQAKGNGPVTFLDLALIRNPSQAKAAKKFINALDTIIRLARELKSGERDELVFILQEKLQLISSSVTNQSSTNLSNPNAADDVPLEDAEPDTGESSKKSQGFVKRVLQSLEDLGIHLHILDVSNIISMLLHRPFDIVTYDIPRLDLAFSWEISFGIWSPPPIVARIGLDFSAFADLSIGYDSHGIDTGKFFDGFYFGDLQNGITGPDIDDFGLTLGVRLAALLQLAVASAGIEGEVRGDVLANWRDVDGDGKMHLDEMVRIVKQDGFTCLFDLRLDVHAIVRLVYSAVGFSGSYDFIDKIIFSLQQQCPKYELAHVVAGATGTTLLGPGAEETNGTLVINVGPFAGQRRSGNTSDGPEDVTITQLAPNVMQVELLGLMQVFEGVQQIYMAGGEGDDSLTLIDVGVPVTAIGGPGNDKLVGTALIDYLDGGPGHDVIRGRGDGDQLYGGPGDDLIYGDFAPGDDMTGWGAAGDDLIDGGSGQDIVYGGAGGDMIDGGPQRDVLFGGGGSDNLRGGSGQDLLVGGAGADMLAGLDGNDILLGELVSDNARTTATNDPFVNLFNTFAAGLPHPALFQTNLFSTLLAGDTRSAGDLSQDTLKGGTGNDLLIGDVGADRMYGGWGNDTIIGHLIGVPGDASGEYTEGNPGDDFICGADGIDTIFGGTNATSSPLSGLADVFADAGQAESAGGFTLTSCTQTTDIVVVPAPVFSVRGVIYEDVDRGGMLDDADKRRGGWTVELLDPQDNLVDTTVSDATSGQYEFIDVTPGQYTVREVRPIGWLPVSPITGTRSVPVAGGSSSSFVGDIDFGNRPEQGQIIVRKFHDLDGDGDHDLNEPFLNNWPIEIVGPDGSMLKRTEDLDRNGDGSIDPSTEGTRAVFEGLPAGEYIVREIPRSGWVQSVPSLDDASTDIDARLTIPDDEVSELRSSLTVTGTPAAQGVADMLSGIEVKLTIAHANVSDLEAYLIAPDGRLVKLFTNLGGSGDNFSDTVFKTFAQSTKELRLADGTEPFQAPFGDSDGYRAEEDLGLLLGMDPRGQWTLILDDDEEDIAGALLDWSLNLVEKTGNVETAATYLAKQASVYQPSTWNEYHVMLGSDGVAALEFGNYELATIHGFKFADIDGNGIRQSSEQGLGGITLFVDVNDNGVRDRGEPRGTTLFDDVQTSFNEAGYFSIGSVKPGTYKVREELSAHFRQTVPMDDGIGSVTPITVTLLSGATIGNSVREIMVPTDVPLAPGLIFANQPLGEILGEKWEDQNGNGQHDSGEPGMAGVTVYADLNHNGQFDAGEPNAVTRADDPATLQVNESGRYRLPNLPSGNYEIREVVPAGYVQVSGGIDLLYGNSFEGPAVGPEWTLGSVQHTPYGSRGFLGSFGNDTASLQVAGVPDNANVTVSFDLFVLGSWKGNAEAADNNQDRFRFLIAAVPQLDTAFSNLYGFNQSFPDRLGVGNHPARTGATEVDTLGFVSPADRVMDSVYHFEFMYVHGTGDLLLDFAAFGLVNNVDVPAQWGIDNVLITTPADFHEIQLEPGEIVEQIDFVNRQTGGEIHGEKFNDLNGNGVREPGEPGEPGIAGVRIYIDANDNGMWEPNETSTFTMSNDLATTEIDETGMYDLSGLPPGQYIVREVVPAGSQQTSGGSIVAYQNDFEKEFDGDEWSDNRVSDTPAGGRHFLGLFGNDTLKLRLDNLPAHQRVSVSADLFIVGSWDGNIESQGPDRWLMREDGQLLVNTTFSNIRNDGTRPPTWQNPKGSTDVDEDGFTSPLDALLIINVLNERGSISLGVPAGDSRFLDSNNDGFVSPVDVLIVFNLLNTRGTIPVGPESAQGRQPQAYPGNWKVAEHPARTGAVENNTLGYGAYDLPPNDDRRIPMDSVYALQKTFSHSANLLSLDFEALGLVNRDQVAFEKWGLDNVVVTVMGDAHQVDLSENQVVLDIDFGNKRTPAESEGPPAPPENLVPGRQATNEDSLFSFSSGGGNQISISDPDAGSSIMTVKLTGTHGTVTLAGNVGITFDAGDGDTDDTMTFSGTLSAINAALSTLTITLDPNFNGTASLEIVTTDQGSAMSPMLTDTDTVDIIVNPVNDPPMAMDDLVTVRPSIVSVIAVTSNDTDPDNDVLFITSFTQPLSGIVTLSALNGSLLYDPDGSLACSVQFNYTIADAAGATDTASVLITLSEPAIAETCVTFTGQKFNDENSNGNRDAGEFGLDGWDIQLQRAGSGPLVATTTSVDLNNDGSINPETESGIYTFQARIAQGQYELKEVLQAGWVATDPPNGTYSMTLAPRATPVVRNFANRRETGSVQGIKWNDIDGNGQRDPGEPGIAGVTIYVDVNNNGVFDPSEDFGAVTMSDDPNTPGDETGRYSINGVPTGRYYVREMVPAGFAQSYPNSFRNVVGLVSANDHHAAFFGPSAGLLRSWGSERMSYGEAVTGGFVYVAAWSDDTDTQGLLAEFDIDGQSFKTGDPSWEVTATGIDIDTKNPPTLMQMNDAIALADFNQSWTAPKVGPPNASSIGSPFPRTDQITEQAQWIWYDSGKQLLTPGAPGLPPFTPGFNHDEFLIFRIPVPNAAHRVRVDADATVSNINFANVEQISLLDGDDTIFGLGGNDQLYGDNLLSNPLMFSIGTLSDFISGGDGEDQIFGQEMDDVLNGEVGHDLLYGGVGTDRVEQTVDQHQLLTNTMLTGQGDDLLFSIELATLNGGLGGNDIDASAFTLGPVVLAGLKGNDHLTGTAFDDRFVFFDDADVAEVDNVEDQGGTDVLDFAAITSSVTVDLTQANLMGLHGTRTINTSDPSQFENVWGGTVADDITGNAANNEIHAGGGNDTVHGGAGEDAIFGEEGADSLFGEDDGDTIDGGADDDTLLDGGPGNDTLSGRSGDDTLVGGSENDIYVFPTDSAQGSDTIQQSSGADTLDFSQTTSHAVTINLGTATAQVVNSNLTLTLSGGLEIKNFLGGEGDDVVTGNSANNSLVGGGGNDTYVFNTDTAQGTDIIDESSGGTDTLDFSPSTQDVTISLATAATAQTVNGNLTLTLSSAIDLENVIGGVGDDSIIGNTLNNTLTGGSGDDVLEGGTGDDRYLFEEIAAIISEQDTVVELSNGGLDHVDFGTLSNMQYVELDLAQTNSLIFGRQFQVGGSPTLKRTLNLLGSQLGQMPNFELVSAGAGDDSIIANGAQNILAGGTGNDRYQLANGLTGDVTLVESATVIAGSTITAGGVDTVDFSSLTADVTFDLRLAANSVGSLTLRLEDVSGNDAPLLFENLTGGSGNDTLTGNRLDNVIEGRDGDNHLYGGPGNDTYVFLDAVSPVTTRLYESSGTFAAGLVTSGGQDTLDFSALTSAVVTFDLRYVNISTNVIANNNVFLMSDDGQAVPANCTGTSPVLNCAGPELFENIIGALNAVHDLTGNQNDNLLVGGNLADTIDGQVGADILIGQDGDDVLQGEEDRDLLFGGMGMDDLTGGTGDDILIGGVTTYDAASVHRDLQTIRTAWLSTANTYTLRIDRIMNGLGLGTTNPALRPRLRTAFPNATVFDDNVVDELVGDEDLDWFLSGVGDDIGPLDPGE